MTIAELQAFYGHNWEFPKMAVGVAAVRLKPLPAGTGQPDALIARDLDELADKLAALEAAR
jgi:hypothetical protein